MNIEGFFLLRITWIAKGKNGHKINKSRAQMTKLKLLYFRHTGIMQRASSLEKSIIPGNMDGRKKTGRKADGLNYSGNRRT